MAYSMASIALASLASIVLIAGACSATTVFDVTKYGAVADGKTDNSNAFLDAWGAACPLGSNATWVVPQGSFLVGAIVLRGPCAGNTSPAVQIQGTVIAPSSLGPIQEIGWIEFRALQGLVVGGGGTIDGQGAQDWDLLNNHQISKDLPISLRFIDDTDVLIANLTVVNSKGFHVAIQRSSDVKVWQLNISAPADSPNTDGIHICDATNVDISTITIATGDDCISIGPGSVNVAVSNIVCGPGHGISVGSLGKYQNELDVSGIVVANSSISHTTNGVRIKTWPGSPPSRASNFTFENIIMNNVSNPIIIDQVYCPNNKCSGQPSLVKLSDVAFKNISGSSNSKVAVKLMCSQSTPCQNVNFQDINLEPLDAVVSNITATCSNILGTALGILKPSLCL